MAVPTISLTLGVDDTGNDALTDILAKSLVRHRVTLTAAILHREQVSAFLHDWRALIAALNVDFVIDEIHASHLVNDSIPLRSKLSK